MFWSNSTKTSFTSTSLNSCRAAPFVRWIGWKSRRVKSPLHRRGDSFGKLHMWVWGSFYENTAVMAEVRKLLCTTKHVCLYSPHQQFPKITAWGQYLCINIHLSASGSYANYSPPSHFYDVRFFLFFFFFLQYFVFTRRSDDHFFLTS